MGFLSSERPGWGGEGVSPIAQMVSLQRGGLWGASLSPGGLSQHLRWPPLVLEDEPQVQMEHPGVSTHLAEPQGISPALLAVPTRGCSSAEHCVSDQWASKWQNSREFYVGVHQEMLRIM